MTATTSNKPRGGRLVLEWLPRLLVAGLFAYTGVTKILDPETFVKEIRAYELIPLLWSNTLAYVLPWIEVFAVLMLVSGLWRLEARLTIVGMLIVFTVSKGYLLILGREFDCGCVPTASALHFLFDGWMGVVTNFCLLVFLGVEAGLEQLRRKPAHVSEPVTEQQEAVPA